MVKDSMRFVDEYFLFALVFLAVTVLYSMPLGNIYTNMTIIGILMYYVAADQNMFRQIPFNKDKKNLMSKLLVGGGFAAAFVIAYNALVPAGNLIRVFAATAFGSNELLGKIVYGILIPPVETIFFFVVLPGWLIYKMGWNMSLNPFSADGLKIIAFFSLVFIAFHFTAKGVKNTPDLIAVFAFAALSIGMIMYFKEAIQAVLLHVGVNSYNVGLFDALMNANYMQMAIMGIPVLYIAIGIGAYIFARVQYKFRIGVAGL